MPSFPTLKTGAVAQYPASRSLTFQNDALRFIDGVEQRYRDSAGPLHRWEIQLDRLDESETAAIQEFFLAAQGQLQDFSFVDPWDQKVYPHCSIGADTLETTAESEMWGATSLTISENRG